jgi:hypothetical protein
MKTVTDIKDLDGLTPETMRIEILAAHAAFRNLSAAIEAEGFEIWHNVDKTDFTLRRREAGK